MNLIRAFCGLTEWKPSWGGLKKNGRGGASEMANCMKCLLHTCEDESLDHQQLHESCTGQAGKMS